MTRQLRLIVTTFTLILGWFYKGRGELLSPLTGNCSTLLDRKSVV